MNTTHTDTDTSTVVYVATVTPETGSTLVLSVHTTRQGAVDALLAELASYEDPTPRALDAARLLLATDDELDETAVGGSCYAVHTTHLR